MKTKHTPGPWEMETVPIQSSGGSNTCHKIGPFNACIYDDFRPRENGISEEENKANAKLIALAPEMLQQLDSVRMTMKVALKYAQSNGLEDWVDMWKAAIDNTEDTIQKATS